MLSKRDLVLSGLAAVSTQPRPAKAMVDQVVDQIEDADSMKYVVLMEALISMLGVRIPP